MVTFIWRNVEWHRVPRLYEVDSGVIWAAKMVRIATENINNTPCIEVSSHAARKAEVRLWS